MRDSLLKDILKEYDAYRLDQVSALKNREAEVLTNIPELARLRDAFITAMAEKARALILNPGKGDLQSEQNQLLQELKIKEAELLKGSGYPEDYLEPRYRCPHCKDTGYTGELIKEKCSCLIQQLVERMYKLSDLEILDQENFDTFDSGVFPKTVLGSSNMTQREYMEQLKARLLDYKDSYPDNSKKNILFTGKTGLGKTFLLNCLAKSLIDKGYTVLKITSYNLFEHLFRSAMNSLAENSRILKDWIFDVDVLIIDDLGTETKRNNFTAEELFNILNERYLKRKHTFLSTNLALSDLRESYSDRVTSRLFDTQNTMIIRFSGQDIRLIPKNQ